MAQERSFPEEKGHLFCPCAVDHSLMHSVSSQFSHSIIEAVPSVILSTQCNQSCAFCNVSIIETNADYCEHVLHITQDPSKMNLHMDSLALSSLREVANGFLGRKLNQLSQLGDESYLNSALKACKQQLNLCTLVLC
jgi:hypothetical protein